MKALTYNGPGQKAWESVPDPSILEPTDAIVSIDTSTIWGSERARHRGHDNTPPTCPARCPRARTLDARGLTQERFIDGARRSTLEELTYWTVWTDKPECGSSP